ATSAAFPQPRPATTISSNHDQHQRQGVNFQASLGGQNSSVVDSREAEQAHLRVRPLEALKALSAMGLEEQRYRQFLHAASSGADSRASGFVRIGETRGGTEHLKVHIQASTTTHRG
ncbi:hypothetical protein, partial [Microbispora sitophila]|uniref:hypothetical protein n=1 Tax=Microbispora sitophila TaxID=2771537 RepID=UPI001D0142A0